MRIGALDIGGTNIKACLFEDGAAGPLREAPTRAKEPGLLDRAAELLSALGDFDAIGVSTAGQVDPDTGVIRYANENIPGYTGTDVKGFFEGRFGKPTAVVNDVYAAALGEGARGAAMGKPDYICLTYGTGIGGGVVLDGKPYYGRGASAGVMLGGLITHPEALVAGDPFSGTYERYASTTALIAGARQVDPAIENGRQLFARQEDPVLRQVLDRWLEEVAAGICALVHCYNIPCVLLGGGIMEQPLVFAKAKNLAEERLIPGFRGVTIRQAALGNMAGLYGAAQLAGKRSLLRRGYVPF